MSDILYGRDYPDPPDIDQDGVVPPAKTKTKRKKRKLRRQHDEHSGQIRMAYRLRDEYGGKLLHVHGIGWHYWNGPSGLKIRSATPAAPSFGC